MTLNSSRKVHDFLKKQCSQEVEEFWALALNSQKVLTSYRCLFRGTVDACLVHPRDIFRFACLANAASLLVVHNHPSHSPWPSPEDCQFTQRLLEASQLLQIPLTDHVIITNERYWSFADHGWTHLAQRDVSDT